MQIYPVSLPDCAKFYILNFEKLISSSINFPFIFSENDFWQTLKFCVQTAQDFAQSSKVYVRLHACVFKTLEKGVNQGNIR